MRVFELAKTLGITSKELMALLGKLRVKAATHMANLDEETVAKVRQALKPPAKKPAAAKGPGSRPVEKPKMQRVVPPAPVKPAVAPRPAPVVTTSLPKPVAPPPAPKPVASAKGSLTTSPSGPVASAKGSLTTSPSGPVAPLKPSPAVSTPASAPKPVAPAPAVSPPVAKPSPVPPPAARPVPAPAAAKPPPAPVPSVAKPVAPAPVPSAPVSAEPAPLKPLQVKVPLTVKELSEKLSVSPSEVIKRLLGMKTLVTMNQLLTEEPVRTLLKLYGWEYQKMPSLEEQIEAAMEVEDRSKLVPRPPIVTLMGHVDHGKTSLLDAIRKSKVVDTEAGGITQHIGAYKVTLPKGSITFLDTPGHEAFTAMRARGANATDIVILVVAADDGVMPQTVEAIDHAKAAEATIVVALNKIDKPSANPDRVKKQLMEHGLMTEDWGGKTILVPVSAKTGDGIDHLLEMLLLEAELLELKANPAKPARGVVLEGELSKGRGPVAHLLVQSGTLRVGDVLVSGLTWGRARAIMDERGHRLEKTGPSAPLELLGLNGVPKAGETFLVVADEKQAREIVQRRQEEVQAPQAVRRPISLEEFHRQLEAGRVKSLNLLLKADVQGSLEALRDSLEKLATAEVGMKFLHVGVGDVTEPDVLLAEASDAVVIAFHVGMTPEAEHLAKQERVDVRLYRIIYEAVADIRAALEGLLEPKTVETFLGRAKVLQVFKVSKVGVVAGSQVLKGKIVRGAVARVYRGEEKLFEGKIVSLKRFKDDVREVTEGIQCGIGLADWTDFQPEDVIEAIEVQQVAAKL